MPIINRKERICGMIRRETTKAFPVNKKIFCDLHPEIRELFPLELWDIITEYCLLNVLYCPVSGRVFKNPVMIDHPMIASLVYDREGLYQSADFEKLRKYRITKNNLSSFLRPVPIVSSIMQFINDLDQDRLFKEIVKQNKSISTNLTEEIKSLLQLRSLSIVHHKKIMNFIKLYNLPISARNPFDVFDIFPNVIKQTILLSFFLFTLPNIYNNFREINEANLDPFLSFGLTTLLAISDYEAFFEFIKYQLKTIRFKYYREFNIIAAQAPLLPVNHYLTNIRQLIAAVNPQSYLSMLYVTLNFAYFHYEINGLLPMSIAGSLFFSAHFYKLNPIAIINGPSNFIGSKQLALNCKKLSNNSFRLFAPSRDENGFIESGIKTEFRRVTIFSKALIALVLTYCTTEDPLLALLALILSLSHQAYFQALKETHYEVESLNKGKEITFGNPLPSRQ
jgi:hypothetical protein